MAFSRAIAIVAFVLTVFQSTTITSMSTTSCPSGSLSLDGQCQAPDPDVGQYGGFSLGGLLSGIGSIFSREFRFP